MSSIASTFPTQVVTACPPECVRHACRGPEPGQPLLVTDASSASTNRGAALLRGDEPTHLYFSIMLSRWWQPWSPASSASGSRSWGCASMPLETPSGIPVKRPPPFPMVAAMSSALSHTRHRRGRAGGRHHPGDGRHRIPADRRDPLLMRRRGRAPCPAPFCLSILQASAVLRGTRRRNGASVGPARSVVRHARQSATRGPARPGQGVMT